MMVTVTIILAVAALVTAILSMAQPSWCPVTVPVLLLSILLCLMLLPK